MCHLFLGQQIEKKNHKNNKYLQIFSRIVIVNFLKYFFLFLVFRFDCGLLWFGHNSKNLIDLCSALKKCCGSSLEWQPTTTTTKQKKFFGFHIGAYLSFCRCHYRRKEVGKSFILDLNKKRRQSQSLQLSFVNCKINLDSLKNKNTTNKLIWLKKPYFGILGQF